MTGTDTKTMTAAVAATRRGTRLSRVMLWLPAGAVALALNALIFWALRALNDAPPSAPPGRDVVMLTRLDNDRPEPEDETPVPAPTPAPPEPAEEIELQPEPEPVATPALDLAPTPTPLTPVIVDVPMSVTPPRPVDVSRTVRRPVTTTTNHSSTTRTKPRPTASRNAKRKSDVRSNGVYGEDEVDQPPTPVSNPAPPYPRRLLRRGKQGEVTVRMLVDAAGKVKKLEIVSVKGSPAFRGAVEKTVKSWRFRPGKHRGRKVSVWARKTIHFKVKKGRRR